MASIGLLQHSSVIGLETPIEALDVYRLTIKQSSSTEMVTKTAILDQVKHQKVSSIRYDRITELAAASVPSRW